MIDACVRSMSLIGSVKDVEIVKRPTRFELGVGRFHFSNRYSIFDWGVMPDRIPYKGASLCLNGAFNFERMEKLGFKTHYRGLVTSDGKLVKLDQIDELGGDIPNVMEIDLTNVIKPDSRIDADGSLVYSYDKYSDFFEKGVTYQIPTENIHRFYLPESSSIFRRLKNGKIDLEDFGWKESPTPGQKLDKSIVDFSSKYEESDRYVSKEEAQKMSGLSEELFDSFTGDVLEVGKLVSERADEVGMTYLDGKLEAFCCEQEYRWSDVVGTQDEGKFEFRGVPTDKEVFREPYRRLQPEWVKDVYRAKDEARSKGISDWKSLCKHEPKRLDELSDDLLQMGSQIYPSSTNKYIGKRIFEVPKLEDTVKRYQEWLEDNPKQK